MRFLKVCFGTGSISLVPFNGFTTLTEKFGVNRFYWSMFLCSLEWKTITFVFTLVHDGDRILIDSDEGVEGCFSIEKLPKLEVCKAEIPDCSEEKIELPASKENESLDTPKKMKNKSKKEKNRGLGRKCFNCCANKLFANSSTLKIHITSGACPKGKITDINRLNELLATAKTEARGRSSKMRSNSVPEVSNLIPCNSPSVSNVINIFNTKENALLESSSRQQSSLTVIDSDVDLSVTFSVALENFSQSFTNPLGGASNLEEVTWQKKVADIKKMNRLTQFHTVGDIFTEDGWKKVNEFFPTGNKNSSKKELVASLIKFAEFLDLFYEDEVGVSSRKIKVFILKLTRAYTDFKRGVKKDDANRRIEMSEMIKAGEFPSFAGVEKCCMKLEKQVRSQVLMFANVYTFFRLTFSKQKRKSQRPRKKPSFFLLPFLW